MNVESLLAHKKILRATPIDVTVAVYSQSSNKYHRVRVSLMTGDFSSLYANLGVATAPKALFYGVASRGLIIQITKDTGTAVVTQSGKTVALNDSAKTLEANELKVPTERVAAVKIEVEGGQTYLVVQPLPDAFLSTKRKEERRKNGLQPFNVVVSAFAAAGVELKINDYPPMFKRPEPQVEETTEVRTASSESPVVEPPELTHTVIATGTALPANDPTITDLGTSMQMLNDLVAELRAKGSNVELRVEDGIVRGRVPIVEYREL